MGQLNGAVSRIYLRSMKEVIHYFLVKFTSVQSLLPHPGKFDLQ